MLYVCLVILILVFLLKTRFTAKLGIFKLINLIYWYCFARQEFFFSNNSTDRMNQETGLAEKNNVYNMCAPCNIANISYNLACILSDNFEKETWNYWGWAWVHLVTSHSYVEGTAIKVILNQSVPLYSNFFTCTQIFLTF